MTGVYTDNSKSQVTNTAWAVLGLLAAKCEDYEAIRRGCRLIMSRQLQVLAFLFFFSTLVLMVCYEGWTLGAGKY